MEIWKFGTRKVTWGGRIFEVEIIFLEEPSSKELDALESQHTSMSPSVDGPKTLIDELETPRGEGEVEIVHSKGEGEPPCKRKKWSKVTFQMKIPL